MKIGDKVKINLTKEIENSKNITPSVLELWENINGKEGIITEINDEEIWVKGNRTNKERMFNKEVLEILKERN